MISEQEFIDYVNSIILLEDRQKYSDNKKKMIKRLTIWLSIEVAILLIGIFVFNMPTAMITFFVIIVLITIICIVQSTKTEWKNLKSKYASQIFSHLLNGYKFSYDTHDYVAPKIFNSTVYKTIYDNYTGEDYLKINIPNDDNSPSNVYLHISDLHLTKEETETVVRVDSSGIKHTTQQTKTYTVFDGIFGFVEFPFEFKCQLALNKKVATTKEIKLEDVDFNKKFKTFTNNQLEALCILTPTFINKVKEFSKRSGYLELVFKGNKLCLKMNKNIFELDVKAKELSGNVFLPLYRDLKDIVFIVEEIKNNNKVFKM